MLLAWDGGRTFFYYEHTHTHTHTHTRTHTQTSLVEFYTVRFLKKSLYLAHKCSDRTEIKTLWVIWVVESEFQVHFWIRAEFILRNCYYSFFENFTCETDGGTPPAAGGAEKIRRWAWLNAKIKNESYPTKKENLPQTRGLNLKKVDQKHKS